MNIMKGEPLSTEHVGQDAGHSADQSLVGQSVVTLDTLSPAQILDILAKARYIDAHRAEVARTCAGRVLATLFYEPSTRTRLSFETAMLRLGGQVIGFAGAQLASVTKGETISDTVKTVSHYADIIAIRHPLEGAALVASRAASVPVINAGDGGHMHPTQTLADLATIEARLGRLTQFTIGLCGDLTFGRTVHSLITTLCRFGNVHFVLISPKELRLPQYVIDRIEDAPTCSYEQVEDLAAAIPSLDVLYMTRVQKERFTDAEEYARLRDAYILNPEKLQLAKPTMAVLHPLPRVHEITTSVDADPRAAYFEQVGHGMLVRMALESTLLGDTLPGYETSEQAQEARAMAAALATAEAQAAAEVASEQADGAHKKLPEHVVNVLTCENPRCVTTVEPSLDQLFHLVYMAHHEHPSYHCDYCDAPAPANAEVAVLSAMGE